MGEEENGGMRDRSSWGEKEHLVERKGGRRERKGGSRERKGGRREKEIRRRMEEMGKGRMKEEREREAREE